MRNIITIAVIVAVGAWFFLGDTGNANNVDLGKVLDRAQTSLQTFQTHMTKQNVQKVTDEHLKALSGFMRDAMNTEPPVHSGPVGVNLLKDSKFEGFADANQDNVKDAGEERLFTLEMDFDGKRLIASDGTGTSTGMGMGTGILTGMLMGHLLSNQRAAGIRQGHFASRNVQSRANYARSRTRSGGRFGGK